MTDVFISYKQDARPAIAEIAEELRELGLSVWFDAGMSAGETFSDEIDRQAHAAKAILVCWSPAARDSRWVKAEAMIGFEQDKLAACYVAGPDGFVAPTPFNASHAEDLRGWLEAPSDLHPAWKSVLRRIGKLCGRADLESWGAMSLRASPKDLQAWLAAHPESPLRAVVQELMRSREQEGEPQRREARARNALLSGVGAGGEDPAPSAGIAGLVSLWKRLRPKPWAWAALGTAAVALGVLVWFGAQTLLRPGSQAIAVLEFRTFEPDLQGFALGLADRLIGAMSTNDLQAVQTSATAAADRIAAAAHAGAAFVLDGSARADGDDLLVNARVVDTRGNIAIWSREYRRVASERNYMQEQIAIDVARVLKCALVSLEPRAGVDTATLAVFMRACQSRGGADFTTEEGYQAAREVTERAPRFSRGWSMRGMIAGEMSQWGLPADETQAYVAEARDAATRAHQLDRSNGESYLIEAALLPARDYGGRQALIAQALTTDPDLAAAHSMQAWLYLDVGRAFAALRSMQRAIALEPLNGDYQASVAPMLNAVGEHNAAQENLDRLYRLWPESADAWWTRLMNATYNGDPAEGLRMLDNIDASPAPGALSPVALPRWRAFLLARQSGDPARMRQAARAIRDLIPGQFSRASAGAALSLAGDVDAALEMAGDLVSRNSTIGAFFLPPWRNMRRDPRFMTLIRDTGLIQYWRETDHWPDFCGDRDLPYNCQQEAARVVPP